MILVRHKGFIVIKIPKNPGNLLPSTNKGSDLDRQETIKVAHVTLNGRVSVSDVDLTITFPFMDGRTSLYMWRLYHFLRVSETLRSPYWNSGSTSTPQVPPSRCGSGRRYRTGRVRECTFLRVYSRYRNKCFEMFQSGGLGVDSSPPAISVLPREGREIHLPPPSSCELREPPAPQVSTKLTVYLIESEEGLKKGLSPVRRLRVLSRVILSLYRVKLPRGWWSVGHTRMKIYIRHCDLRKSSSFSLPTFVTEYGQ